MEINNCLVIGNTSQLSKYFPKEYDFISSRNINIQKIIEQRYNTIYLLFAEQRTFLNETDEFFINVNVNYTLDIINKIKDFTNRVVIYSTSELWNSYNGCVSIDMVFKYNKTPYIYSKDILSSYIKNNRNDYKNIIIIYPFNFNSPHRSEGFLFNKIFNSIINKQKISIGYVNFNRDLVHPSIIVKESINADKDKIVGSGELINVQEFIIDLYKRSNLKYEDYIEFKEVQFLSNTRNEYFSNEKYCNYNELINLTIKDINEYTIS